MTSFANVSLYASLEMEICNSLISYKNEKKIKEKEKKNWLKWRKNVKQSSLVEQVGQKM